MPHFGGNEFTNFSVPLAFAGRYFILEPGNPPLVSVVLEHNGNPLFEIIKNQPTHNPVSQVSKTPAGIVTVSDETGKFLYKVRPGSETSVVFGKIDGGEISVHITDAYIKVGTDKIQNNLFVGTMAGVVVHEDGGFAIGAPIPPVLLRWFKT